VTDRSAGAPGGRNGKAGDPFAALRGALDAEGVSNAEKLGNATALVAKLRVQAIAALLRRRHGATVLGGPFQGMRMPARASEGCLVPKLLGIYEQELHPYLARLARRDYARVVDIGCAEGYYAVGIARALPAARVVAFDTSAAARALCAELAKANGVETRVNVRGAADAEVLEAALVGAGRSLVLCDCEGCEYAVLDPAAVPALARADLIVELHGVARDPGAVGAFLERFRPTHRLQTVRHGARDPAAIPALKGMRQLDQWLAVWEFRTEATPWAVMQAKATS
jgi:predicted O-methyltransferase YrrM